MARALRLIALAAGVRLTRLTTSLLGFARTVKLLGRIAAAPHIITPSVDLPDLVADVRAVDGPPYHASCLHESLFLWLLLRRRRLDPALRIGVVSGGGALAGHAWIELDGRVVNDAPDVSDKFTVFDEDPVGIVFT